MAGPSGSHGCRTRKPPPGGAALPESPRPRSEREKTIKTKTKTKSRKDFKTWPDYCEYKRTRVQARIDRLTKIADTWIQGKSADEQTFVTYIRLLRARARVEKLERRTAELDAKKAPVQA